MGHATEKLSVGALLAAFTLAAGVLLPVDAARASAPTDGVSLFTPGSDCGPAETLVGTGGVLARVRADAPAHRRHDTKARASERRRAQQAARASAPPRPARKAPSGGEQEPRAAFLRSFYTCSSALLPNLTEGTGWRLVGPLRQS